MAQHQIYAVTQAISQDWISQVALSLVQIADSEAFRHCAAT